MYKEFDDATQLFLTLYFLVHSEGVYIPLFEHYDVMYKHKEAAPSIDLHKQTAEENRQQAGEVCDFIRRKLRPGFFKEPKDPSVQAVYLTPKDPHEDNGALDWFRLYRSSVVKADVSYEHPVRSKL